MNKAWRLCIFPQKDKCQTAHVFKAYGSAAGRRGQTNIWFASRLWGRNADDRGIQNKRQSCWGFHKTSLVWNNDSPWTDELQLQKHKQQSHRSCGIVSNGGFSLSWDVLHGCPCLLWALLINKSRLSLADLPLPLKAVYGSVCECVRGETYKVLQWWMCSNPACSVWLINVASSVQKPVWFSFLCGRAVNLSQLSFQEHTLSSALLSQTIRST